MLLAVTYRALGAVAITGFLAGCSGVTQAGPAGSVAAQSGARRLGLVSQGNPSSGKPFLSESANAAFELASALRPQMHQSFYPFKTTKKPYDFLFATGTDGVNVFNALTGDLVGTITGVGGISLATNPRNGELAIGTFDGNVSIWKVNASGATATGAILNLSSGTPNGITFDSKGDLYATEYPSSKVDLFRPPEVKSGGQPFKTYTLPDFSIVYYLTASGSTILVDGNSLSGAFAVGEITAGGDKILQPNIVDPVQGKGFPGGLALDAKKHLIVNDQWGSITTYVPPYTGKATSLYEWTYNFDTDYAGIALTTAQTGIWSDNASGTYATLFSYPLGSEGIQTTGGNPSTSVATDPAPKQ